MYYFNLLTAGVDIDTDVLVFIKFFSIIFITLILFGIVDAYHPPAIGAMLTYLIEENLSVEVLLWYVMVSVVFMLVLLKWYVYKRFPHRLSKEDFRLEFTRDFGRLPRTDEKNSTFEE